MRKCVLVYEYNNKKFMNLDRIIEFKENLKLINGNGKSVNLVFYGDVSNEELATFMGYFNSLVQEKVCNIAISFKSKEIVIENGINNKSIKLSTKNSRKTKNKKFDNLIKEYYSDEDIEIRVLPTKDWEKVVLDLIDA